MSKVFGFRLSDDNPREAQAMEVIETWVSEGYSLRQVIVDVLLSYKKTEEGHDELESILEQLQDLILSFDKSEITQLSKVSLSNSVLDASSGQ